jgi:hypothetical protein
MFQRLFNNFAIDLPRKRPFNWHVFVTLVALFFLGNLAGIPLLLRTNVPIEPIWIWGVVTVVSALAIALSLAMANRTGLGAPLLEGRLSKEDFPKWLSSGLMLTMLILCVGLPFSLLANRGGNPATYPFGWELLSASFKAGVVEEIAYRLFLVSLIVWLGGLFKRDGEGRPTRGVYWMAILIAGIVFGWAHVDAKLGNSALTFGDFALIMVLSSGLGMYFGWLYWKLGLEWSIFAHFAYDAFVSMIVIPVFLL